ncbi:MAG: TetR/AcrR family transcriptional regulator [Gammaproteobacteria bacterium]
MKTRDKILQTALELFNQEGEASVTTLDIAQTLNISPGNLYYHFRGKEDILSCVFDQLYLALIPRLEELEISLAGLENQPIVLEALFDTLWDFRFAFLDTYRLATHYPRLKRRLQNLLARQQLAFSRWVEQLENVGLLRPTSIENRELLIECLTHQSVSWIGLSQLLRLKESPASTRRRAVAHVMSLITQHFPYNELSNDPPPNEKHLSHTQPLKTAPTE